MLTLSWHVRALFPLFTPRWLLCKHGHGWYSSQKQPISDRCLHCLRCIVAFVPKESLSMVPSPLLASYLSASSCQLPTASILNRANRSVNPISSSLYFDTTTLFLYSSPQFLAAVYTIRPCYYWFCTFVIRSNCQRRHYPALMRQYRVRWKMSHLWFELFTSDARFSLLSQSKRTRVDLSE